MFSQSCTVLQFRPLQIKSSPGSSLFTLLTSYSPAPFSSCVLIRLGPCPRDTLPPFLSQPHRNTCASHRNRCAMSYYLGTLPQTHGIFSFSLSKMTISPLPLVPELPIIHPFLMTLLLIHGGNRSPQKTVSSLLTIAFCNSLASAPVSSISPSTFALGPVPMQRSRVLALATIPFSPLSPLSPFLLDHFHGPEDMPYCHLFLKRII